MLHDFKMLQHPSLSPPPPPSVSLVSAFPPPLFLQSASCGPAVRRSAVAPTRGGAKNTLILRRTRRDISPSSPLHPHSKTPARPVRSSCSVAHHGCTDERLLHGQGGGGGRRREDQSRHGGGSSQNQGGGDVCRYVAASEHGDYWEKVCEVWVCERGREQDAAAGQREWELRE